MSFLAVVHWLSVHSILAMIAMFSLIVLYAYWPGVRALHDARGEMPLRDDFEQD